MVVEFRPFTEKLDGAENVGGADCMIPIKTKPTRTASGVGPDKPSVAVNPPSLGFDANRF